MSKFRELLEIQPNCAWNPAKSCKKSRQIEKNTEIKAPERERRYLSNHAPRHMIPWL